MSRVIQINKKRKWRIAVIIVMTIIGLMIGGAFLIKNKMVTVSGNEQMVSSIDEEAEYVKLEELFQEQKDLMQECIDGLSDLDVLRNEVYNIQFSEERFRGRPAGGDCIDILYSNDTFSLDLFCNSLFPEEEMMEIEQALNARTSLIESFNSISDKEVIVSIYQVTVINSDLLCVKFEIDTEYTNNGRANLFMYCEDESVEEYGYRYLEDNWYMYICPLPG